MVVDKKVLVTTALEETFPENKNEKILFLGEWCKIYSKKNIYEEFNFETLKYHWDDRKRLYKDSEYLTSVYEHYLESLSQQLNKINNVSHY